jgi:hydrogenase-4 component E
VSDAGYLQLLDLTAGALLLTAVLTLWRPEPPAVNRFLVLQGIALAGLVAVRAGDGGSVALAGLAAGILVLRAGILPYLVRRLPVRDARRQVSMPVTLLAAAALTLVAFAVSQPVIRSAPAPATGAVPAGVAVLLIGFFVLVTRRRAVSQLVGFLLMDNGITAIGFLTTSSVPLIVGLEVSLDVLFAVLVLQILATRMRATFGHTELDELRELRD